MIRYYSRHQVHTERTAVARDVIRMQRETSEPMLPRNEEPRILYKTDPSCERCKIDPYVPHYNCLRPRAVGHSGTHCTADSCY